MTKRGPSPRATAATPGLGRVAPSVPGRPESPPPPRPPGAAIATGERASPAPSEAILAEVVVHVSASETLVVRLVEEAGHVNVTVSSFDRAGLTRRLVVPPRVLGDLSRALDHMGARLGVRK